MAPFSELRIPFVYAGEVMAAGIVIPIVAISVVASRFWLRSFKHIGVGVDDWFILASLVCPTESDCHLSKSNRYHRFSTRGWGFASSMALQSTAWDTQLR